MGSSWWHKQNRKYYKEWVDLYNSGYSLKKIRLLYNKSENTIRNGIIFAGGKTRPHPKNGYIDYYTERVIKTDTGCWGWDGSLDHNGYAVFFNKKKRIFAHRYSYETHIGKIPSELIICHKCDNPICTNPDHLFIGTYSDNSIDCVVKGRHGHAKLTIEIVKNIKSELNKNESVTAISKKYKVHFNTISDIKHKRTWRHVV